MTTPQRTVRPLTEDLDALGLGGIDLSLAGMTESVETPATPVDAAAVAAAAAAEESEAPTLTDEQVTTIVEAVYADVRAEINDDEIDYTEDDGGITQFEADLKESILDLVTSKSAELAETITEGDDQLEEQTRVIRKLVGGSLKNVRQKLIPRAERRKASMERRRTRGASNMKQRKYRKTHRAQIGRHAKRRARAESDESGGSAIDRIRALIGESEVAPVVGDLDGHAAQIAEGYERLARAMDTLAIFFEDHGNDEDWPISEALTEGMESMAGACDNLVESELDLAGHISRLQKFGQVVDEALTVFESYEMVPAGEEDDDQGND